ncbi:MAG: hypothetical protein AAFW75_16090 [Cyanobacteria bacterium J06636_16]
MSGEKFVTTDGTQIEVTPTTVEEVSTVTITDPNGDTTVTQSTTSTAYDAVDYISQASSQGSSK